MHRPERLLVATAMILALAATQAFARTEEPIDLTRAAASTSPSGNYLAGRVAADSRDMDAAAVYLRAALTGDPKNADLLDRTFRTVLASGSVEQALSLADRVIAADPTNRLVRTALAVRAIKARQFVTARTQLGQSLRSPVPDIVATLVVAWSWQGSGDTKRALETVDTLRGNELAELFRDLHAGMIADVAGRADEAETRFAAAYKRDQSSFVVVDAYARRLARSGRRDEALALYNTLAENGQRNGRLERAIAGLEAGRRPDPTVRNAREGAAEALFGFGQLANRGDSAEIGLIYLNLALFLGADNELALLTLANLYETIGQHEEAIAAYKRIPADSAFGNDIAIRMALNLSAAGRDDEARKALQDWIAKHPEDRDAHVALGNFLHSKKEYAAAAESFGRAIALTPEPEAANWTLFFARAVAYHGAKDWPRAERDLVRAHELDPQQAVALNYLGYSWVDRGENLDRGVEMIREAVALRPNDGDIIDSLGWAHYRLGNYQEAMTELERAVEIKPQSWEINDHLGDVYWKVGRKLEANFQWLHALQLQIDEEQRPVVERKLAEGLEPVEREAEEKRAAERALEAQRPAEPAPEVREPAKPAPRDDRAKNTDQVPSGQAAEAGDPASRGEGSFTVRRGDSLWTIAQEVLGDGNRYPEILRINTDLRGDPGRIQPGQMLIIPAGARAD